MKDNILYSFVYLLAMLAIVPVFFKEGQIFDVTTEYVNECGMKVIEHEVYYDNVFSVILTLLLSFLGGTIPLFLSKQSKLNKMITNISFMISAWFLAGFVYEVANFAYPTIVLNNGSDMVMFNRFLIMFIIGLTLISINSRWNKQKL